MDLRNYFQKIKEIESKIAELFTLVISLETAEGGKAGTAIEVSRSLAAKLVVDGLARFASESEKDAYYRKKEPSEVPGAPVETPAAAIETLAKRKETRPWVKR